LADIDSDEIDEYIYSVRNRKTCYRNASYRREKEGGPSGATINDHIRILKVFFNWAYGRYKLPAGENPMGGYKAGESKSDNIMFISDEDRNKMLLVPANDDKGIRDKAIVYTLTDTGCRVGALVGLQVQDVHFGQDQAGRVNAWAEVETKGDTRYTIFFSHQAACALQDWLRISDRYTSYDYVFCNLNTNRQRGSPLLAGAINQLLDRIAEKAGVTGTHRPHSFRHAFARTYLKNGGDLASLAQIMGHKTILVTARYYARFLPGELGRMHGGNSPLSKN
jgi:integrase/recombinase XerD